MPVSIAPMSGFGAEVGGLDVRALTPEDRVVLRGALSEYGILIARGLALTPADHVELTRVFGDPDIHPIESIRLRGTPEVIELLVDVVHTVGPDDRGGDDVIGGLAWHSDLTYVAEPSRGALLYALEVPAEGGDTGFVDTARVYEAIPDELRGRIAGLEVVHTFGDVPAAAPEFAPVTHPIVHRHPVTGQPVLNISPLFARSIVGWSAEDSRALLDELTTFATQDRFTHFHTWSPGDLVVWDNWRTMHSATGHPRRFRRHMLRTTVHGGTRLVAA